MRIFRRPEDYAAFVDLLIEGLEHARVEVFGFCLMPNHWHLALRPERPRDLAAYLSWASNTHVKRYRAHYRRTSGHLYQGRYKSFAVEEDAYFLLLMRYIEANALRAGLVRKAQRWPWSSLGCDAETAGKLLSPWPVDRSRDWAGEVNAALPEGQLGRVRVSVVRGRPLGSETWTRAMARRLGLQHTLRPRGRPPKD
jgi:putative transposase